MLDARILNPRYDLCPTENCENCPLDKYGMSCTSHREKYQKEQEQGGGVEE